MSNHRREAVRIFHVDDEPGFAEITADFLEREDDRFTVVTETSASDGLDRLDNDDIDCIVSDYDMPRMNGIEFLQAVREESDDTPFILFTGKGSEEVASDAISAGVTDYLQKGSGTDQYTLLANRIRNAVARYRSEQQLRRTTERFQQIFEQSNDAITVIDPRNDEIRNANSRACEMLGYDREELLSLSPADLHPDDFDRFETFVESVYEEGSGWAEEVTCIRKDGSEILTEISASTIEIDDQQNLLAVIRDITERKEREEELELFRSLLDHSEDEIYVIDPDTAEFLDVNETVYWRLGYDRDELLSMTVPDIDPTGSAQDWETHLQTVQAQQPASDGLFHQRKDGSTYPVEVRADRVALNDEEYLIAIARDITERKEYEQELERQNEQLEEFASIVSHDLRNPLNVAEGNLELAQMDCESEHLDDVARAHDRMRALIEDLLTLTREGGAVTDLESINLGEITENCWQNVDTEDATLAINTQQVIQADPNRFKQLVENLIRNAVEHGGGDVTITVGELDDRTGFYVADDGPGIPADERDQVFEAGYSTASDGTGFGLSIVKQVVEAHEWEITVTESEAGGARFEITGVEFGAE